MKKIVLMLSVLFLGGCSMLVNTVIPLPKMEDINWWERVPLSVTEGCPDLSGRYSVYYKDYSYFFSNFFFPKSSESWKKAGKLISGLKKENQIIDIKKTNFGHTVLIIGENNRFYEDISYNNKDYGCFDNILFSRVFSADKRNNEGSTLATVSYGESKLKKMVNGDIEVTHRGGSQQGFFGLGTPKLSEEKTYIIKRVEDKDIPPDVLKKLNEASAAEATM